MRFRLAQKNGNKKHPNFVKIIKKIGFFFLGLLAFIIISSVALAVYVKMNRPVIIAEINHQINENINGNFTSEDIKFKIFKGFPNVTFALNNVEIRDSLWSQNKISFLKAREIEVRLNVWNLLNHKINIHKIIINDATLSLFKNGDGYGNAYILLPKKGPASLKNRTSVDQVVLNRVHFISKNPIRKKFFHFFITQLKSKLKYKDNHLTAHINVKALAKNMTFKAANGSFLKNKTIQGALTIDYSQKTDVISTVASNLKIGNEHLDVNGHFNLGRYNSLFALRFKTYISWKNAADLVSDNIRAKLLLFDAKKPVSVNCLINGDLFMRGSPEVVIQSEFKNNELKTPEGTLTNCSFDGIFTNNNIAGKGYNDANSEIRLNHLKATYKTIPFEMAFVRVTDIKNSIASGNLRSEFEISKMNEIINEKLIHFTAGQARVNLDFRMNLVDFKLNKPHFTGTILASNTALEYVPKNLRFNNTNVELRFTPRTLFIKKIQFRDQSNTVYMDGKIDDFLNVYCYPDKKMHIDWNMYAPRLDVQQFIGMLTRKNKKKALESDKTDGFSNKLQSLFDKCDVNFNLRADRVIYEGIAATNVYSALTMKNDQLNVSGGRLNALGGTLNFNGVLLPKSNNYSYRFNSQLSNINMEAFLMAFDNFGVKSLQSKNIKGQLSALLTSTGDLLSRGQLKPNSLTLNISDGSISCLGGTIAFDGQLYPKNKMYFFDFNTKINQVNSEDLMTLFNNFGMKSVKAANIKGPLSAQTSISGLLLSNWHLHSNSINMEIKDGTLNSLGGNIAFEGELFPKNKSYAFNSTIQINEVSLEQFIETFNYFGIKSLQTPNLKGGLSASISLNGTLLTSGNLLNNSLSIDLKKGFIKTMDGTFAFDGQLFPKNKMYAFNANAVISNINVVPFLGVFNNFGIKSFKPQNITGKLSAKSNVSGFMAANGGFVSNSITGDVKFDISDGSLIEFEPVKKVWKFIFPFRDFKNIVFSDLSGNLSIKGDKVNVRDMAVSSNVLNFDINGIYSFSSGTELELTIPLRNPKKDEKISDEIKKAEKRDNGIVLHLVAVDEEGKIKIKWSKKHKREKNNP